MKIKIVIADITTLSLNGKIYGHFGKSAKMYNDLLSKNFLVKIAGGEFYKKETFINDENFIHLPYCREIQNKNINLIKKYIIKMKNFLKEYINTREVIDQDCDVIIFQSYSKMPIYLNLILKKIKNKKIYMIEYQRPKSSFVQNFVRKLAMKKINGIITSSKEVGKHFNIPYIVVSDYFYINTNETLEKNQKYDYAILGTISPDKNYEDIINAINKTHNKLLIAGKFLDENRYKYLKQISNKNKNIEIINKYLDDIEYNNYINSSKFIVLPYNKDAYNHKSSGVVLDALYNKTPVIAPKIDSFKFIEEYDIGILYDNSFNEIIEENIESKINLYEKNILKFLEEKKSENDRFIKFIM